MLASFQAVGHVWQDKDLSRRAVTTGGRGATVVKLPLQTQNGNTSGPVLFFFILDRGNVGQNHKVIYRPSQLFEPLVGNPFFFPDKKFKKLVSSNVITGKG